MTLAEAINAAHSADDTFSAAVLAAGFKSRWDVSSAARLALPALQAAYVAKVDADEAMHAAFAASRADGDLA